MTVTITNCIDCAHHKVQHDPDPLDWFNDDDVKVVCRKVKQGHSAITTACRPYNIRKECEIPKWCPLANENEKNN